MAFNHDGSRIYAGYNRMIRVFHTARPGRDFESRATSVSRRSRSGQRGLISCLSFNPDMSGLFAAGSYAKTTCLYEERSRACLMTLEEEHAGGVTQVTWSHTRQVREPIILYTLYTPFIHLHYHIYTYIHRYTCIHTICTPNIHLTHL